MQRCPRPCQFVALERSRFSKIGIFFLAPVPLKLLVSLISRLVSCSARIVVDTQTDRHTERLQLTLAAHARRGLTTTGTKYLIVQATDNHYLDCLSRKLSEKPVCLMLRKWKMSHSCTYIVSLNYAAVEFLRPLENPEEGHPSPKVLGKYYFYQPTGLQPLRMATPEPLPQRALRQSRRLRGQTPAATPPSGASPSPDAHSHTFLFVNNENALKCKPLAQNAPVVALLYAGPCVVDGASRVSP